MVDHLSDWTKVRKLARSVVPADFTQLQIEFEQDSAASWIDSKLDMTIDQWQPSQTSYKLRVKLEQITAALFILGYEGVTRSEDTGVQQLIDLQKSMWDDLMGTIDLPGGSDAAGEGIERIPHRDWGRNVDVSPPNAMNKFRRG